MPHGPAPAPSPPVALGVALTTGGLVALLSGVLLGRALPDELARSLVPWAAAALLGALAALALAARTYPKLTHVWRRLALAGGVAAALVATLLAIEPHALARRAFGWWAPLLATAGLVVWLRQWQAARTQRAPDGRWTAVLGGLALAAALLANGRYVADALRGEHLRTWNVFHYYLGAKYFAEVGYSDLYAATLAADDDWQQQKAAAPAAERGALAAVRDFRDVRQARDMRSYRIRAREQLVASFDRSHFTPERWRAFGRDTRWLRERLEDKQWPAVLQDWGYNPPPPRTALDALLARWIALDSPAFLLIANSDLPLFVLVLVALWWAFGPDVAFAAVLWCNCIDFNRGRFAGGFWQYDWLASAVLGLALYRKGYGRSAGVAFAWSVMTRVFPALLAAPIVLRAVADGLRRRPLDAERGRRRGFALGLGAACVLLGLASLANPRGPSAWLEWGSKIDRHRAEVVLDARHIGAGRLAQHEPTASDPWAERPGSPDARIAAGAKPLLRSQLVGLPLLVLVGWRRRDLDAALLGLFAAFLLVTLTRYYATLFLLLFAFGSEQDSRAPPWLGRLCGAALLAMAAWSPASTHALSYLLLNLEILALGLALCALLGRADWRAQRAASRPSPQQSPLS